MPRVSVRPVSAPHLGYDQIKRSLDVLGAVVLLLGAAPLVLAAAVAIRLTSPGPVIFRQQRLGYMGEEFTFYKLRTMVADAEAQRAQLRGRNITGGPAFKVINDPRVTRVGQLLRNYSIDELPQLWNVLKGEMSLVGPRALPVEENRYDGDQAQRLAVKPGLTCSWQVGGRSSTTWDEWMAMDLDYVRTRSLLTDLRLLLRTPAAVLSKRGAS